MYQGLQKSMVQQPYIPGLTPRPSDVSNEQLVSKRKIPKDVPQELIESFKSGSKHPVSALMEYCAMQRLDAQFQEVAIGVANFSTNFAYVCKINGEVYPQGIGKTKKEAKTNAAKIALSIALGLNEDSHDDDNDTVLYDTMGRKLVLQGSTDGTVQAKVDSRSTAVINSSNLSAMSNRVAFAEDQQAQHPVSALQEYCANARISFTIDVRDEPGPFGFICRVEVQGQIIAECTAKNKKDAKRFTAEEALEYLQMDQAIHGPSLDVSEEDIFGALCYKKLHEKVQEVQGFNKYKKSFAAFVIKRGDSEGQVVALGIGNTCLSGEHITTDGRCLVDSYALALARRALLKYFHKEMKSYYEGNRIVSIFEETVGSPLLQMKDYIKLHLLMNHPPAGDYAYYSEEPSPPLTAKQQEKIYEGAHFPAFNEDLPGWFCTKNEDGVISPVEEHQHPQQSMEELKEGEDLLVMSCSDKLLLWNVVGIQGALFSAYLQPTYLNSIIISSQYDHGHFSRAVCCRVYGVLQEALPSAHYQINHPVLSYTEYPFHDHGEQMTSLCMNWSFGEEKVEITDGFTGKETDQSPFKSGSSFASRLCKAAFLHRFRELSTLSKRNIHASSYAHAKHCALDYQKAKKAFREHCAQIGIGNWVRKPSEIDKFSS